MSYKDTWKMEYQNLAWILQEWMYSTVLMLACLLQIYFICKVPVHNSSHLKELYTIYTLLDQWLR